MKGPSRLPAGLRLVGDVAGTGDLVVAGQVDGGIRIEGRLDVERGGVVRGDVRAAAVTVRGRLVGDAVAREVVRVESAAVIVGDLRAPRVDVARDADVRGRVTRDGAPEAGDVSPPEARAEGARREDAGGDDARGDDARGDDARGDRAPRMPRVGRVRGRRRGARRAGP